jgi:hypothetical protein
MIPWAGGAGVGHLHPEHAVQAELHDLYKNIGGFRETFLRSKRIVLKVVTNEKGEASGAVLTIRY